MDKAGAKVAVLPEGATVVIHAPAGSGKTRKANAILCALGLPPDTPVVDEWDGRTLTPGALHLTNSSCGHGGAPAPGTMRKLAGEVRPGDRLVLGRYEYLIEDVSDTNIGMVCFTHGNGTASDCYWPTDPVLVR